MIIYEGVEVFHIDCFNVNLKFHVCIFWLGSDHHVGARQAPRDLDLDNVSRFPQAGNVL